jgi:hypothetical protein
MVIGHIGASTCVVVKKCRAGREETMVFVEVLRVSQRHTSGPKAGKNQTTFRSPDMRMCILCPIPGRQVATPLCPTRHLSPTPSLSSVCHISRSPIAFAPSHLSSIHYPTCRHLPSHLPPPVPLRSTSPLSHYTSAPACVTPQFLPSHRVSSTWPSHNPVACPSCHHPRQILIHVHDCLAIPASIQLSSRWQNAEATKFHRCSVDLGLPIPMKQLLRLVGGG